VLKLINKRHSVAFIAGSLALVTATSSLADKITAENDDALFKIRYGNLEAPTEKLGKFPFANASATNEFVLQPTYEAIQSVRHIQHEPTRRVEFLADECGPQDRFLYNRDDVSYVWSPLNTASVSGTAPAVSGTYISKGVSQEQSAQIGGWTNEVRMSGLGAAYECSPNGSVSNSITSTSSSAGGLDDAFAAAQSCYEIDGATASSAITHGKTVYGCISDLGGASDDMSTIHGALSVLHASSCQPIYDSNAASSLGNSGGKLFHCSGNVGNISPAASIPLGGTGQLVGLGIENGVAPSAATVSSATGMACTQVNEYDYQAVSTDPNHDCWGLVKRGEIPDQEVAVVNDPVVITDTPVIEDPVDDTYGPLNPLTTIPVCSFCGPITPIFVASSSSGTTTSNTTTSNTTTSNTTTSNTTTSNTTTSNTTTSNTTTSNSTTSNSTTSNSTTSNSTTSNTTTSNTTTSNTTTSMSTTSFSTTSFSSTTSHSVPEPGSAMLIVTGLIGAAWYRRRKSI
jgi:hypothetical protein